MSTAVNDGAHAGDPALDTAAAPAPSASQPSPAAKPAPPASIVAYPDGPLLVRGEFEIVTPDGVPVPRDRETVALCRCGASAIKPYCDGTHKLIRFETSRRRPVPGADPGDSDLEDTDPAG